MFNVNFLETPLELLNDFLQWFQAKYLLVYPDLTLEAHYNYELDLSNPIEQKYLLSYFQLVQKYLGILPAINSHLDLEKQASYENSLVIEAGSQWSCLDNYLVHVVLSKGGSLFQPDLDVTKFQIISESPLSPNHSIQLVKKLPSFEFDITCTFLEDLSDKNFYKHPNDMKLFYYLIYKNIFKA
jgi:hypothetical protein